MEDLYSMGDPEVEYPVVVSYLPVICPNSDDEGVSQIVSAYRSPPARIPKGREKYRDYDT